MTGLIWFVQVVHYPLFAEVGESRYREYHRSHMGRTTRVVAPVMMIELVTAVAAFWLRPLNLSSSFVVVGLVLLATIWLSTFLLQVPAHEKLAKGFESRTYRALVMGNWIRTAAWSGRALWLLFPLAERV